VWMKLQLWITSDPSILRSAITREVGRKRDNKGPTRPMGGSPTLAEATRQALTPDEADRLSAHLQPLVEQGHGKQRIAVSYLSALRL
jgi:hypothetical protein